MATLNVQHETYNSNPLDTVEQMVECNDWAFDRRGDELTALLAYDDKLIGNPMLPALHGGVTAAFLEVTAIVGLGYKASLVPFHFWVPDAYQGGPLSIAAYLSVVPKVGALFALTQVLRDLPLESGWTAVIAGLAVLSMTYGYLAALAQDNVVRLLAYSSIAQSGYFLLGILAVGSSSTTTTKVGGPCPSSTTRPTAPIAVSTVMITQSRWRCAPKS